jgi:hypothetical protein
MLVTRSSAESHLYMDLHPCACGETRFDRRQALVDRDGALVSRYAGTCAGCGAERSFEFRLADGPEPFAEDAVAYGGAEPSAILDPGQFLAVADRRASAVPASATSAEEQARGRDAMKVAIGALREVLKFIPEGADRVPADAFTSDQGRAVYRREPGRFDRARLEAVLAAYVESARAYAVH